VLGEGAGADRRRAGAWQRAAGTGNLGTNVLQRCYILGRLNGNQYLGDEQALLRAQWGPGEALNSMSPKKYFESLCRVATPRDSMI
jgi:hypothetical protein